MHRLEKENLNGVVVYRPSGSGGMAFTTRSGGVSTGRFRSLNLGYAQGDDEKNVDRNRAIAANALEAPSEWAAPKQVHGNAVADSTRIHEVAECEADAVVVRREGVAAAVVTADCVPILLKAPDAVAAVHAGWRGLCDGIVAEAVSAVGLSATAVLGPSIGVCHYEVGSEVPDRFHKEHPGAPDFSQIRDGKLYFDLQRAVIWALGDSGIDVARETPPCTYCEADLFSHRRDGVTGRQAALVWM